MSEDNSTGSFTHKPENNVPRFDLTPEEIADIETELIKEIKEVYPEPGVFSVWITNPRSKYADIVRTYEANYFPEVKELDPSVEDGTLSLLIVDTREGVNRSVHACTVWGLRDRETHIPSDRTGMFTVDDLIGRGNFSLEEFQNFYEEVDLQNSFAIETNFRIGDKVENYNGVSISDLAYLSMFELIKSKDPVIGHAGIFASINEASAISFDRFGLQYEPLMGRRDLITSETGHGRLSQPVFIPYNEKNVSLFMSIEQFVLPEITVNE